MVLLIQMHVWVHVALAVVSEPTDPLTENPGRLLTPTVSPLVYTQAGYMAVGGGARISHSKYVRIMRNDRLSSTPA